MDILLEGLHEALHDTWMMLPLLYIAYLFIEWLERRQPQSDSMFFRLQKLGPLFGALVGLLPQCGFAVLGAMLFAQNSITLGTMLAIFIATSDEAIPILLSEPAMIPTLGLLLVMKFILAAGIGFLVDKVLFPHQKILSFEDMEEDGEEEEADEEMEEDDAAMQGCSCCYPQYPIWISAFLRTIKIYFFVFVVTFVMTIAIEMIGPKHLETILLGGSWLQPNAATLIGLIPNCAATVVLCQLYASGALSFASLFAGLCANAGMGLVVLFRYDRNRKDFVITLVLLILSALAAGYLWMGLKQLIPGLI